MRERICISCLFFEVKCKKHEDPHKIGPGKRALQSMQGVSCDIYKKVAPTPPKR
jgi:hypothetical protein